MARPKKSDPVRAALERCVAALERYDGLGGLSCDHGHGVSDGKPCPEDRPWHGVCHWCELAAALQAGQKALGHTQTRFR